MEDFPPLDEGWVCGNCGLRTFVSHFRHGTDGVMFHADADAPASDQIAPIFIRNESDGC